MGRQHLAILFAALVGVPGATAGSPMVALHCEIAVKGLAAAQAEDLCRAAAHQIGLALRRRVQLAATMPARKNAEALRLRLDQPRAQAIEVRLDGRASGSRISLGPIAIDVMDRSLGRSDVETLLRQMAEALRKR